MKTTFLLISRGCNLFAKKFTMHLCTLKILYVLKFEPLFKDLHVYVSENLEFRDFNDSSALVWIQKDLSYGDFESGENSDGTFSFSAQLPTTQRFRNNGSLYLHAYIVRSGKSPDPASGKSSYSKKWTLYKMKQLNKWESFFTHFFPVFINFNYFFLKVQKEDVLKNSKPAYRRDGGVLRGAGL